MSLEINEVVDGKYRVLERLGAGGMGEVYKVEHIFLRATRVIKVIRPQISQAADAHNRFLREAQLATKVQHPNVATLHDFSALPDGSHYMVWEYIEGENLAQVIRRRGVLAPPEALRLTQQTLAGLEAIHRAGIIHRDMSPENLMITPDGAVKIIDLGVAKAEQGDYAATQTGMFVGKFRYSSPEQLGFLPEGEKIDARADLYSMAIVLYEMLTGRPPFEATSPHEYFLHHSRETTVHSLDLTRVPNDLRPVLAKALERDRNRRFATARDFSSALEKAALSATTVRNEVIPQPPVRKPQTGLLIAIVAIVIAFGALVTWRFRSRPEAIVTTTIAANQPQPQPAATTVSVAPPPSPAPVEAPTSEGQPVVEGKNRETNAEDSRGRLSSTGSSSTGSSSTGRSTTGSSSAAGPSSARSSSTGPSSGSSSSGSSTAGSPATELTYVDGKGSSLNDAALAFAQQQLRGVTSVSLDSSDPQLAQLVTRNGLTVADGSNVVIHFNGSVTHLRFGRKSREGHATITKKGQTVFRYELKPEEYRVGDNPAEAFARVLRDVFGG